MIRRYKEIFFALLLGLAMWAADAVVHTVMEHSANDRRPEFIEELLLPGGPQLGARLLYLGFAVVCGWLLWRSNRQERAVRDLERRIGAIQEQIVVPATLILHECNDLLRSEGLKVEAANIVRDMRDHARRIDDCVKDFSRRVNAQPDTSSSDPSKEQRV